MVDNSGDRFPGLAVEDADEDGDDGEAASLEAVAEVGVGLGRRFAADVVVSAVWKGRLTNHFELLKAQVPSHAPKVWPGPDPIKLMIFE